jgi:uncharacterized protein (TIGR03437 family)
MEPSTIAGHPKLLTHPFLRNYGALLTALLGISGMASGQQSRIIRPVDNTQRVTLTGHIHPKARPENDRGRVAPSLELSYVTLNLTQSAAQKADLANLLAEQQNPSSPNYHRWLTPGEYADRFGVSAEDISKITQWLRGQGLTILNVAQGRNWIAVSGSAAQIDTAFATEIHQYAVDGETHFANATEPSVPAAFGGVVLSIRGLNDFRMKARVQKPRYTSPSSGNHYLAPNDVAAIYDINPAYAAGINGTGQAIVVAGQSDVPPGDIAQFQSAFGLPSNPPQMTLVPGSQDPGISSGDREESDLDLEWAGAVARNATIKFVYSYNVMDAVQYAIGQNLAPVLSLSYGSCEPSNMQSDADTFESWARQGNAQGITWFNADGDNGAADCFTGDNTVPAQLQETAAVDLPASVPEVTGVGGTEFQEGGGSYWNATNDANGGSALLYIPEVVWNTTEQDGTPSASGGGVSIYFSQPAWQTGFPGVPGDNARHVPDVALNASPDHDGYLVYTDDSTTVQVFGGTSCPTPVMAGIAALLNQYQVASGKTSGQGNINPQLYALARSNLGIFHDVTQGDNTVTVTVPGEGTGCGRRQICPTTTTTVTGYSAGVGYDSVTGLGSLDAWRLFSCWSGTCTGAPPPPVNPLTVSLSLVSNLRNAGLNDFVSLTATATANDGMTTPQGVVQFSAGPVSLGPVTLVGSAGISTATLLITGSQLPVGATTVTASYEGSSSSAPVTSSVPLSRAVSSSSNGTPGISGLTDGASFQQKYSPGMIMSVFGNTLSPAGTAQSAGNVPLPVTMAGVAATVNGIAAPLYYVSPTQLNIQLPWQLAVNAPATLVINNNGQQAIAAPFSVVSASPGIFTDQTKTIVPNVTVTPGQTTTLYMAGAGAVTPAIATGSAPSSNTPLNELPAPQGITVTVNGVPASTTCSAYCFVGIPPSLVGVTQINFQVPSRIPAGLRPVVVTVNGVASAPAYLNVTN